MKKQVKKLELKKTKVSNLLKSTGGCSHGQTAGRSREPNELCKSILGGVACIESDRC